MGSADLQPLDSWRDNFNTPTSVAHILATQLNIAIVLIDYKDNRINMSTSSIVMLF